MGGYKPFENVNPRDVNTEFTFSYEPPDSFGGVYQFSVKSADTGIGVWHSAMVVMARDSPLAGGTMTGMAIPLSAILAFFAAFRPEVHLLLDPEELIAEASKTAREVFCASTGRVDVPVDLDNGITLGASAMLMLLQNSEQVGR